MKHGARVLSVTLTLLGLTQPAFAVDTPPTSNLQAGGLKPPEAIQSAGSPTPATQTETELDRADKEDSGRGLEFVFLNAELGPEYLGLHTLKASSLVDAELARSKALGMAYGAGAGIRLLAFTFGARFRFGNFTDFRLWTLNAEAGMHIPLGHIEPYFTLGGGYASLGGFDAAKLGSTPNAAHGLNLRGGVGIDVYLSNTFSVGSNLTAEALFLGISMDDRQRRARGDRIRETVRSNDITRWIAVQLQDVRDLMA